MTYSVTWDNTTPAGSEARSLGDNRIRELKLQIQERLIQLLGITDMESTTVNLSGSSYLTSAEIIALIYPVGSLYISTSAVNPATLFGVGTWEAFGTGRVLVGYDASQTEFDTVEETGGENTHTLTEAELASHRHPVKPSDDPVEDYLGGSTANYGLALNGDDGSYTTVVGAAGSGDPHNNLQPYIVVHIWKRTA